jgi:diguanylate cyclase (GGDEF)-like protein
LAHLPKKEVLQQDLLALVSQTEPTGLIILDLDGFKAVNERNGYPAGDKCLEAFAGAAFEAASKKGKVYRFREGDELAVVLRNATVSEAKATADRIREAIDSRNLGEDVKVTASVGVASSSQPGLNNVDKLLEAAEEALHVSKYTTKNCVTAWPIQDRLLTEVREKRNKAAGR